MLPKVLQFAEPRQLIPSLAEEEDTRVMARRRPWMIDGVYMVDYGIFFKKKMVISSSMDRLIREGR